MDRKRFLKTVGGGTLAMSLAPNLMMAESLDLNPFKEAKKTDDSSY